MARSMLRLFPFLLLLLAWNPPAWSQTLTPAQYSTLKTDITVTRKPQFDAWISPPADKVDDQKIADFYNALASPTVNVWRPDVRVSELNTAIDWAAFNALDTQHQNGYMAMTQAGIVDTTAALVRKGFADIFTSGTTTANNILALVVRPATNLEVLFSTVAAGNRVTQVYGKVLTNIDVAIALRGNM
jgi:hypothetical protein